MVVMRAVMLRFALKFLLISFIKRPSFVTSYSVCYSFDGKEVNVNAALQNVKTVRFNPASLFELLLLLSSDIEVFPGPTPSEIP